MGVDYTEDQWRRANARYADVIEAYQILKDQSKRKEYDARLSAMRRQKAQEAAAEQARRDAQARARQNVNAGQGYYDKQVKEHKEVMPNKVIDKVIILVNTNNKELQVNKEQLVNMNKDLAHNKLLVVLMQQEILEVVDMHNKIAQWKEVKEELVNKKVHSVK
jgi:DnaJ-class molecular chaperone